MTKMTDDTIGIDISKATLDIHRLSDAKTMSFGNCPTGFRSLARFCAKMGNAFALEGAKFPRDYISAVIVQDRAEIEPTPADDLQVGEVSLPKLIDGCCLVFELTSRLDHYEGWAGDQVMRLQYPIRRSL